MDVPFKTRIKVRHYEVDEYGHVNHANYVHYLEVGRIEALEAIGLGLPDMRRQGYLIVASEITVKYAVPARAGDMLDIATHVSEMRGARSIWIQEIRDATSGRVVVTAEVTGAVLTEDGRPIRMPESVREKLARLQPAEPA